MIHIPGFNSIRFIAALAVVITHIENIKRKSDIDNFYYIVKNLGTQGVSIFFVLSGFLITYLLINEKVETHTISIRKFYIRRILRVWPLYFFILLLGFLVFPTFWYPESFNNPWDNSGLINLALHIFLLPNLSLYLFGPYFCTSILWSIGIEEQFYLIWPRIFGQNINMHKVGKILLVYLIVASILLFLKTIDIYPELFELLFKLMKHDGILFGAFFAFLLYEKKDVFLAYIEKPHIVFLSFLIPVAMLYLIHIGYLNTWGYFIVDKFSKICYAILILNIGFNKFLIRIFENNILSYFGKISYGIYVYHSIAIAICISILKRILAHFPSNMSFDLCIYITSISLTLLISSLSYQFFEKPILRWKSQFAIIKSRS